MPRPRKSRRVCSMPQNSSFMPIGGDASAEGKKSEESITMAIDEYETIRLIDLAGYTQEECAEQMGIARTTVQGIYNEARRKLADVLVNGRVLLIEGGNVDLCQAEQEGCDRKCRHICMKTEKEEALGDEKDE